MWLEDMTQTFRTRYTQWKKDHDACQTAGTMIAPQEALCSVNERALNERAQECGRALDSVESFSCSWATGFAARCSAYDTCFASVLTGHSSYASAYPCTIDFERFRAIADETGAIAHISWSTGASWRAHRRSKQWHRSELFNGMNILHPNEPVGTVFARVNSTDTVPWGFWGLSH